MCACRLDSPSSQPSILLSTCEIDDLLPLLTMSSLQGDTPTEGDLYAQLAQKEQDLILAAELGKALLEKNQDLSVRNEQLVEEYSSKIEELEQERHELHLRLEKIEAEYDNTVKELQFDISNLRHELHSSRQQEVMGDKERAQTIRSLKQQNERLNEQLKQSRYGEGHLQEEVQTLREQMMSKRTSMHEHVIHLELLREEKQHIFEKCQELEKQIQSLTDERDNLACSLEESHDRIMVLERQKQEKDQMLHQQHREVLELQEANAQLQAQVEHLSQQSQSSSTGPSMNLFSELSAMSPGFETSLHSEMREEQHPLSTWHRSMSAEMIDDDDYECDDDQYEMAMLANSTISNESSFLCEFTEATAKVAQREEDRELRNEVIGAYTQLRKMLRVMKGESMCSNDSSDEEVAGARGGGEGRLDGCLMDLQQLMQDMMTIHMEQSIDLSCEGAEASPSVVSSLSMDCMEKSISDLHEELMTAQRDLDKVKQECATRDAQLMQKSAEFAAMAQKYHPGAMLAHCCFPWMTKLKIKLAPLMVCYLLQEQQDRLVQLQRERDKLQDTQLGPAVSRDSVVEQARKDRDLAMEKGHQLEVELMKAKMDLMSLNQQLVGAIKQKDLEHRKNGGKRLTDMEHILHYETKEKIKEIKKEDEVNEKEEEDEEEEMEDQMKKSTSAASFFALKKS